MDAFITQENTEPSLGWAILKKNKRIKGFNIYFKILTKC